MEHSVVQLHFPGHFQIIQDMHKTLGVKRRMGNTVKFSSKSKGEFCLLVPILDLLTQNDNVPE